MTAVATIESPALDLAQAQRLTERARLVVSNLMEARAKLAQIMTEAQEGRVWEALDMPNIQAWAAFTFSETPLAQLSRDDRRVLVKELSDEGFGTRPIAAVVGTDHSTVSRDIKAVSVATATDGPRQVHGADGITRSYPKPEPVTVDHKTGEITQTKPKRRPLPEAFRDAAHDLRKITERLERLAADDRFPRNREQIAETSKSDFNRAEAAIAAVLDSLTFTA